MLARPLRRLSSFINDATDLARGVRQGIFGYPFGPSLSDEALNHIFLLVEQFTRDEWDQALETEQDMVYLGLGLSHVCRQWRRVALRIPSLWSGIRICQYEQPVTLPKSTRHFLRYSSPLLLYLTVSADNYRILERLPAERVRSLVIYGTFEAIYDASEQWGALFPALEDLIVQVSPLPPPIHGFERVTPIVGDNFFNFFPSMTWLTLRNVDYIPHFQRISALHRLTWTMDPQCELESLAFAPFHDLTDIRYLELDVPNLTGGPFRIARPLEEVVFKNAGTTIMNALNRAFPPNLTSLTITSSEDITFKLLGFLEGQRGNTLRKLSLSLIDISSVQWFQILRHVPNVKTLEAGFTPTNRDPEPFNGLMDALAVHREATILVPLLSELRLAGDVLSRIERVLDFIRVRRLECEMEVTPRINRMEIVVLPTDYFTWIPEWLAHELESLVVVLSDAALNRLVEPMEPMF
jgi:hypothetical protein